MAGREARAFVAGDGRRWSRLVEPSRAVVDRSERRTARLLATLLLLVAPLGLASAVLQIVVDGAITGVTAAVLVAVAAIAGTYALSRTHRYRIAGAITTLIPTAGGLAVLAASSGDPGWFAFMALNPALGTVLVPLSWAVTLALVNVAAVGVAVLVASGLDTETAIVAVNFNIVVVVVLLTAAWFRNRLEQDRRAELVARDQLQSSILAGTFGGIAIVRRGTIDEVNDAFSTMFGRDDLRGARVDELFAADPPATLASLDARARPAELVAVRRDGSTFDAEVLVRRTTDDGDGDGAEVIAVRDVSDRRQATHALLRAQRMETVGRLAAGIAHDTNNELLVIGAYADELAGDLAGAGRSTDSVAHIRAATDRVSALIRRVVLFGRDDPTRPVDVAVAELCRGLEETWRQVVGSRVRLELVVLADGRVRVDPARFEQLMLNLVLNARDAVDGDGAVRVSVDVVPIDGDTAGVGVPPAAARHVRVRVRDDGPGVPAPDRDRLFDAFFTTKGDESGTGLGLYTSRQIARDAGGELRLEGDGPGATFALYLPELT